MKNRKSNGYYTVSYQQIDILRPYIIVWYGYSLQNGTNYSQNVFFFVIKCRFENTIMSETGGTRITYVKTRIISGNSSLYFFFINSYSVPSFLII